MKILHINYSDLRGGAAVALNRLHNSFLKKKINSWLLVNEKISKDKKIIGLNNIYDFFVILIKKLFIKIFNKILKSNVGEFYSLNYFSSKTLARINNLKPDIVHLYWINNEMISIDEIAQIKQPFVWTILDMWPFSGVEHYNRDSVFNKKKNFSLIKILNNYIKKKKFFSFKRDFEVIAISKWLANKAKKSSLFKNKVIHQIPLGLDFTVWKPINKIKARRDLNFDSKKKYIIFSSTNGTSDARKGFDIFLKAINLLKINKSLLHLIIIGKLDHGHDLLSNQIEYTVFKGFFFNSHKKLIKFYSACDLLIAPSIQEAFGQVALEASSCNLPTVAFDKTGFADIIRHKKNGYLAKFHDIEDFAKGVDWFLKKNNKKTNNKIRKYVKNKFSINLITDKYKNIYLKILKKNEHKI
jgi:glycosyltransferase involved in cell wall biosynthesis